MQIQYDTESNHSQITEQQKKWEQKVDELLKSLDQYTEPTVTVTLR
jgi:tetrahydromethanopterin S-methyltransferase subunit B